MANVRIQLSHRAATGWREPDRGRRHEFPRPGAGPLGRLSLRHRTSSATAMEPCSVRKGLASIPKAICMSSMDCGAWCRFLIAREICSITSEEEARTRASFNCRRDCSSIATTGSSWWIRINRRIQVFHYFGLKKRQGRNAVRFKSFCVGIIADCWRRGRCWRRSPAM